MRHLNSGRKLSVDSSHRIALMRSLSLALVEHEQIKISPARAKELRWFADRLVTLAKRGDISARRRMVQILGSAKTTVPGQNRVRMAVDKLFKVYAPRFQNRPGGYTQLLRLATRRAGDNAEMCVFRYIPEESKKASAKGGQDKKKGKKVKASKPEKNVQAAADKAPKDQASSKASDKRNPKKSKESKKEA